MLKITQNDERSKLINSKLIEELRKLKIGVGFKGNKVRCILAKYVEDRTNIGIENIMERIKHTDLYNYIPEKLNGKNVKDYDSLIHTIRKSVGLNSDIDDKDILKYVENTQGNWIYGVNDSKLRNTLLEARDYQFSSKEEVEAFNSYVDSVKNNIESISSHDFENKMMSIEFNSITNEMKNIDVENISTLTEEDKELFSVLPKDISGNFANNSGEDILNSLDPKTLEKLCPTSSVKLPGSNDSEGNADPKVLEEFENNKKEYQENKLLEKMCNMQKKCLEFQLQNKQTQGESTDEITEKLEKLQTKSRRISNKDKELKKKLGIDN